VVVFDDDVWRYSPVGPVLTIVIGLLGMAMLVYVARVRSPRTRRLASAMLVASVLGVLLLTTRGGFGNEDGYFSWRIGHSIVTELHSVNRALGLVNVVGNVLMFLPVGWLVAVLALRLRLLAGALAAGVLSVAVETGQVFAGSFGDIDDLLLNSLGGFVGAGLAVVARGAAVRAQGTAVAKPARSEPQK
jgi:VanZ like family